MIYTLEVLDDYTYRASILDKHLEHTYVNCSVYDYYDEVVVTDLFTNELYRRQQYATRLMKFVRQYFRKDISIRVRESDDIAMSFYKKLGFEITDIEWGDGLIDMVWSKSKQ